ncbi:metallophosphoesterase [Oricola sp.]|uniref:metallophosphoesterase n=1 Tax=Oricola sp. TaxID=1979950 RepID=UPI003BAB7661
MLLRSVLALATAAPMLFVAFPSEDAYARTLTSIKAGERCSYPTAPKGVFVGSFLGYEESRFNFTDAVRQFHTQRCFATHKACDNWLYTMQSKYDAGVSQARCRYKG